MAKAYEPKSATSTSAAAILTARGAAPTYVEPYFFGLDYRDFYDASQALAAGKSPYEVARYVTPPLPALANVPLSLLVWPRAVRIAAA